MRSARAAAMALVLVALPLVGCLGGGEDTAYSVEITLIPSKVGVGEPFQPRWVIEGPAQGIEETSVHWGPDPVDDPAGPDDYPERGGPAAPVDPDARSTTHESWTNVTLDDAGTWYFRARAGTTDGDVWSDEATVEAVFASETDRTTTVAWGDVPAEARAGETMHVTWSLSGTDGTATETGVAYGNHSVADPNDPDDPSQYGGVAGRTRPARVPDDHGADVPASGPGTLYLRAYALRDGRYAWSEERAVEVTGDDPGGPPGETSVRAVDVAAGALRFEPHSVTIQAGGTVNWTNAGQFRHTVTFEDQDAVPMDEEICPPDSATCADAPSFATSTFMGPGTYPYRCRFHSTGFDLGMVGEVVVEATG